jgi:uncharacterized protein YvpB/LysM repeat protein
MQQLMPRPLRLVRLIFFAVWLFASLPLPAAGRPQGLPLSAYVHGVVGHPQTYALSCESRSAVDWARFFGVSIGESEFLNRLPRSDNPNVGFVGDPNGYWGVTPPNSYGVHAPPVAELLRAYGLEAEARHGFSWDELRGEIADGRPVIVWIIGQMWGGNGFTYRAVDGESLRVAAFEHTMILVGYDENRVHAVDSSTGYTQAYSVSAFLRSWEVLGNMAVTGGRPAAQPNPPPPATTGDTYTVQRGDYLVALARQFGVDWQELASLNNIPYPYTLYAGQTLKLPVREGVPDAGGPLIEEMPHDEPEDQPLSQPQAPIEPAAAPPAQFHAPTATPETYAFLVLSEPYSLSFPLVAHQGAAAPPAKSDVVASGVCLFKRLGLLYLEPVSYFRGWCFSADRIRPEHFLGLAGVIPELP